MWDKRVVGQSVTLQAQPALLAEGQAVPRQGHLEYVTDDNTRELQLRGNQIQVDEFPPFNSITKLQNTPGVTMSLFPSTRTDYLDMNENYAPLADVHVRRAISTRSTARDRQVGAVRPRPAGQLVPAAAGAVLRQEHARPPVRHGQGQGRDGAVEVPEGLQGRDARRRRRAGRERDGPDPAALAQAARHRRHLQEEDTSTEFHDIQKQKYQLAFSYWTMDIADPDELVTFAVDPKGGGAHSFYTTTTTRGRHALAPGAARDDPAKRQQLYSQIQKIAAEDAFLGFLYYSPFRYAYSLASCTASSSTRSATTTSRTSGSVAHPTV
jgi:peptide/nickel transport system substrate-binding protein